MLNGSSIKLIGICLILDKFCCRIPQSDSSITYFQVRSYTRHRTAFYNWSVAECCFL